MIQIAIVDDLLSDRKVVREYINNYFQANNDFEQPIISEFESGEEFLCKFQPNKFHIIVLDIYMDTLTGIETAKQIREIDTSVCFIFLTTSQEHVYYGYSVQAVQYVLKPLNEHGKSFYNGLTGCMERLSPDRAVITIHVKKCKMTIPLRDILYADCVLRDACLHLSDGRVLATDETIGELSSLLLEDNRFLGCHRNTILNMSHIHSMSESDFQLRNNEKIPFAQRRKTELRKQYMDFFIRNGGD